MDPLLRGLDLQWSGRRSKVNKYLIDVFANPKKWPRYGLYRLPEVRGEVGLKQEITAVHPEEPVRTGSCGHGTRPCARASSITARGLRLRWDLRVRVLGLLLFLEVLLRCLVVLVFVPNDT